MTRRIISVALIVLGVVAIALAIASATVWRPTDTATLTLPDRPEAPVVVSDPGVLDAVAEDVTITATAGDDEPVVLVVARSEDVDAWVGEDAHVRITGLSSWEQLDAETRGESAEALPNPAGSDLWPVEQTGTGTAEIEWEDVEGRWSLLAATDGESPAPQVALSWPVEVRTPWLVPGLVAGAVLLLAGLALLALDLLTRREAGRRTAGPRSTADTTTTSEVPTTAAAGLTRRELRERARAEEGRGRTGEIPVVAGIPGEDVRDQGDAGAARGAAVVPGSIRSAELRATRTSVASAPGADDAATGTGDGDTDQPEIHAGDGDTDQPEIHAGDGERVAAGTARGAGIVPASRRADEYRTARADRSVTDAPVPAGPARGAEHTGGAAAGTEHTGGAAAGTEHTGGAAAGTTDEEAPSWRSMWGFREARDEGEQR
ncbi:hypothetical protein [Georgenia muralis]|uniref:Uncharacterized protein n=1 Tax=Georgenia muralis TaxID=154117 RepID=A0A3N4Z1T4_9MICO|nr:hypothetical protein [Georgenia muralis]RPF25774.1 hypothetical protein EDD32_0186 [Georgenia muralis]